MISDIQKLNYILMEILLFSQKNSYGRVKVQNSCFSVKHLPNTVGNNIQQLIPIMDPGLSTLYLSPNIDRVWRLIIRMFEQSDAILPTKTQQQATALARSTFSTVLNTVVADITNTDTFIMGFIRHSSLDSKGWKDLLINFKFGRFGSMSAIGDDFKLLRDTMQNVRFPGTVLISNIVLGSTTKNQKTKVNSCLVS